MPTRIQIHRHRAFLAQTKRCFYCRVSMWLASPNELPCTRLPSKAAALLKCTAEHLVPQCEGGRHTAQNIAAACAHCNHTRHKRKRPPPPQAYLAEVRRRVAQGKWHQPWVFERGLLAPRLKHSTAGKNLPAG